ncbi:MAG: HAMP domain-containing histidine kinase [Balneolaceae bacterium]|nr:HAMP domain-containing histidine kinase [Balneolaceae bacterium]
MNSLNKVLRNKAIRYLLLGLGFAAVIALTGMNVYSLYDIRDKMTMGVEERQIALVEDLIQDVRREIYSPFTGLNKIELEPVEYSISESGQFPPQLQEKIEKAAASPLFTGIYYTPADIDPCLDESKIYAYNYNEHQLEQTGNYPTILCDGVGLARTKARIELNSFNYRWNNNIEFDAHRTMNIGFINLKENRVIGYLTTTLDKDYIVNDLIQPLMTRYFSPDSAGGTVLWLHDWANDVVLATNDPSVQYDFEIVDKRQRFGTSMFENWNIKVAFMDNPLATAYNDTLVKNLVVLGFAVLFLVGALLFMFYTAQRERALALRQAGFLANVTHELKTPLAVMQAAGENISDGRVKDTARLKQYGDHIYSEAIRLRKMIEKLLDVAKTDSGQTLIQATPVNVNEALKAFVAENREYIESKGFNVGLKLTAKPALVMLDHDHFENVIGNLTENAIKYSRENKNILYTSSSSDKEVTINVSDTGIGIPRKHIRNIFKKFYRVEDTLVAKTKGHGLGLSIVRNLIQLNGGKIDVQSEVGIGTTFSLKFPILVKEEHSLTSKPENNAESATVIDPKEYA